MDKNTHKGKSHVQMETEMGVMCIQGKEHQGMLATIRSKEKSMKQMLSQSRQKTPTRLTL